MDMPLNIPACVRRCETFRRHPLGPVVTGHTFIQEGSAFAQATCPPTIGGDAETIRPACDRHEGGMGRQGPQVAIVYVRLRLGTSRQERACHAHDRVSLPPWTHELRRLSPRDRPPCHRVRQAQPSMPGGISRLEMGSEGNEGPWFQCHARR